MLFNDAFYKHHITFTASQDLKELIHPLKKVQVYYFGYQAVYDNGMQIRLTSRPNWTRHYYENKLFHCYPWERKNNTHHSMIIPWLLLNQEPIFSSALKFKLGKGLTILERQQTFCEIYHFSLDLNCKEGPLFLMNYTPLLYRFIAHFKEKAKTLLSEARAAKFMLPFKPTKKLILDNNQNTKIQTEIATISQQMDIKRLYLGEKFNHAYITRRELDIISLLIKGKTSVDAAKQLSLSIKTMETHLAHIKEKFKCSTLLELGFLLGIMKHNLLLD